MNDSFILQFMVFVIRTLVSLAILRPLAKKMLQGNVINTNADSLIGRQYRIYEDIHEDNWGSIKINGSIWGATTVECNYISKDTLVEVIAIEGIKLIVKKVGKN